MASIQNTIGNYHLLEELASGSFGRVYRGAHAILTNRIVAIKLMHGVHLNSQKERDSFIQEALLLERLKHPHILPIVDVGFHEGFPYMVTEYAPNGSLRDRLRRQSGKPLPEEEAISILSQISEALQQAHEQHIIHRDLKPENILFNARGEVVLADFGIATVLGTLTIQQATIIGTPPYMAPEQFKGMVGRESDQYALGCIAYELFTGRQPFTAPDFFSMAFKHIQETPTAPRQLNANLPVHIEQAVLKAMAKERAGRHSDISAFVGALRKTQKTKEQWLDEGKVHYDAKRYEQALYALEQALRLAPTDAFAYNGKGSALRNLKRYEEALTAFEQALRLAPTDAFAYNGKGSALGNLKRYDEALAACEQALRLDPNYAAAYYGKGGALRDLKRYDEALAAFEQALRLDPTDAAAYYGKGGALWDLKRYDEALAACEQALRLDPTDAAAYNGKGGALRGLKRYDEALAACEQALRLDPTDAFAYYGKGYALWDLKRYDEALAACEQALRLDPNFAWAYHDKGYALWDLKRYDEALAAFEQALRLDPNFAWAYYNKSIVLKDLGRRKEAKQAYAKAKQLGHKG